MLSQKIKGTLEEETEKSSVHVYCTMHFLLRNSQRCALLQTWLTIIMVLAGDEIFIR